MYSIFRATSEKVSIDFINKIGETMNTKKKDIYKGLRKSRDGFVCDISKSSLWATQIQEIKYFIEIFKDDIKLLKSTGYEVVIDIAIDPTDLSKQTYGLFLYHDNVFIKILFEAEIDYEISIYKGDSN
jgi:hypothetical protein